MSPPLLIYVAGPYRAANTWGVDRNIQRAREAGAVVAHLGHYPVIPHSNTAHFDGVADDQLFLEGTMKLLTKCDGAIFLEGWVSSTGSRAEWVRARQLGIPRFTCGRDLWSPDLKAWLVELAEAHREARVVQTWAMGGP